MHETAERAHRSQNAGRMHACGHDGHTTMLLGAARYLSETRAFEGTAHVIFQPAEEHGGGGNVMVQEGLFERFPMDQIYALHNWPGLAPGKIAVRAGPVLAATDEIRIAISGRGGHAALPHLAVDPVVVAAHVITALQTIASRNVSPLDAIVVSICSMQTSQVGAFNVIPDAVQLIGTVRTFPRRARRRSPSAASARSRPQWPPAWAAARKSNTSAAILRQSTRRAKRSSLPRSVSTSSAATTSCASSIRPWAAKTSPTCCRFAPAPTCCSDKAAAIPAATCTIPTYDFNDDVIPLGAGYLAALAEAALA